MDLTDFDISRDIFQQIKINKEMQLMKLLW